MQLFEKVIFAAIIWLIIAYITYANIWGNGAEKAWEINQGKWASWVHLFGYPRTENKEKFISFVKVCSVMFFLLGNLMIVLVLLFGQD